VLREDEKTAVISSQQAGWRGAACDQNERR